MCFSFFTCLSVSLSFHLALSSHVSLFCFISLLPLLNALCVVCCCVCCVLWLGSACCCGCSWCGCGCVVVSAFLLVLHFKTLPCVRSKRSRVYFQNASVTQDTGVLMAHTGAFWTYTRKRFEGSRSLALFLSLPLFSCLSLPSHVSLFCLSLCSSLFPSLLSLYPISSTMTMIARPDGSLSGDLFASCKKQLSKDSCASLEPLWNEVGLYLCWKEKRGAWCGVYVLYVFVRVAIWCCVLSWLSSLCCCLRQRWRRCVGCCVVRKWRFPKKKNVIAHKLHPQGIYLHHGKKRGKNATPSKQWGNQAAHPTEERGTQPHPKEVKESNNTKQEKEKQQHHPKKVETKQHHANGERRNAAPRTKDEKKAAPRKRGKEKQQHHPKEEETKQHHPTVRHGWIVSRHPALLSHSD